MLSHYLFICRTVHITIYAVLLSTCSDSVSALIDLDDILLDSSALSQMPAPLLPTSSTAKPLLPTAFDSDTVRHIDPTGMYKHLTTLINV